MKHTQTTSDNSTKRHFGFLLMQNFSLIAYASAIETLRLANHVKGEEVYSWDTITPNDDIVEASNGLEFKNYKNLNEVDT